MSELLSKVAEILKIILNQKPSKLYIFQDGPKKEFSIEDLFEIIFIGIKSDLIAFLQTLTDYDYITAE